MSKIRARLTLLAVKAATAYSAAVAWLQDEPVIAHVVGGWAVTALAHYGLHLDATTTVELAAVANGIAAAFARRKVRPKKNLPAAVASR